MEVRGVGPRWKEIHIVGGITAVVSEIVLVLATATTFI